MADESNINRISLRVPADLFEELDKKRWHEKTTFQQVGMRLLEEWLSGERKTPGNTDGEFIKCPTQFREFINTMINRLMALSPDEIPEIRKLMIRFTEPGHIQQIIEEEERRTLRPRAVSNKK